MPNQKEEENDEYYDKNVIKQILKTLFLFINIIYLTNSNENNETI